MPRKQVRGDVYVTGDITLGGSLTPALGVEYADNAFTLKNAAAPTKKVQISAAGVTAGQTRVLTAPDYNGTVATLGGTETLSEKTLAAPTITGALALAAAGFTMAAIARTATADGTGTGTIASGPMLQFISVTAGGDANSIIVLPAPTPGSIVLLHVGATGYELRSSAPATVAINGGAEANAESAIGANTTVVAICASATSWKAFQMGGDGTLAQVEAAAA